MEPIEWLELCFAELFGRHPRLSWQRWADALDRALRRGDRYGTDRSGAEVATELLRARAQRHADAFGDAEGRYRVLAPGRRGAKPRWIVMSPPTSLAWLVPTLDQATKQLRRDHGRTAAERSAQRGARPETVARREKARGARQSAPRNNKHGG